ncbi:MAG: AraC family transcriptional regulator [Prevotellaceae bacterium]|jgi:AraC-like DNA-binding protein|nr:AraC family transcriptional regulator [Prevotellaceae bacterium]
MENTDYKSMNYSDILYTFFSNIDTMYHDKVESHFIMYVISGKVIINENGKEHTIHKGECVFVRKDHRVKFAKNVDGDEPYKSVTLEFNRNYLRKFYQKLDIDNKLKTAEPLQSLVRVLEKSPYLDSLFLSMIPFFESDIEPRQEFVEQKLEEGIWALLNLDKGFYPALFDFADPWKIDILDFLNNNYMYELSMEEIASYTGRSLATFKRDFAKISNVTPQKWLIHKRLEKAYDLIVEEGRKVTDVCYDVGFKNRSHFTTAFKKQYGFSPANTPIHAEI